VWGFDGILGVRLDAAHVEAGLGGNSIGFEEWTLRIVEEWTLRIVEEWTLRIVELGLG